MESVVNGPTTCTAQQRRPEEEREGEGEREGVVNQPEVCTVSLQQDVTSLDTQ